MSSWSVPLNDDNIVRLVHEVAAFREDSRLQGPFGTLLDVNGDAARRELWSDQLSWIDLQGLELNDRTRSLEVFLDCVAAFASENTSWLLDERFSGLLSPEQQHLVTEARSLYEMVSREGGEWEKLAESLRAFGAGTARDGQQRA